MNSRSIAASLRAPVGFPWRSRTMTPLGLIPIAALHPFALGGFRGALGDAAGKFLGAGDVVEFDAVELRSAIGEVHVGVVEARQQAPSLRVDHVSLGAAPGIHL